eukprot:gene1324-2553_t
MDDGKLLDLTSLRLYHTLRRDSASDLKLPVSRSNIFLGLDERSSPAERIRPFTSAEQAQEQPYQHIAATTLPCLTKSIMGINVKEGPRNIRKAKIPKTKIKSKSAWPDYSSRSLELKRSYSPNKNSRQQLSAIEQKNIPESFNNNKILGKRSSQVSFSDDKTKLPLLLKSIEQSLRIQHKITLHDVKSSHTQVIDNIDSIIDNLPLAYMYSKPNLRKYAEQKVQFLLMKPLLVTVMRELKHAFIHWRIVAKQSFILPHEKRLGVLLIVKAMSNIIFRRCSESFYHWARLYSSRFDVKLMAIRTAAATEIQRWYRHLTSGQSESIRKLLKIMNMCIQRRNAIRFCIRFEMKRVRAIEKMRNGIANRRRYYFAARVIQRLYRWVRKCRRVRRKLVRRINARYIQRWIRKMHLRSTRDLLIIRIGMRCGGPTKVFSKIPQRFHRRRPLDRIEGCIYSIQMFLLVKSGLLQEHLNWVNRVERNRAASIIQNSYQAYKWNELLINMKYNNKARRVQRGVRAHQTRVAVRKRVENTSAKKIQKFTKKRMWLKKLEWRFKMRAVLLKTEERVKAFSAVRIQHAYRVHEALGAESREELRKQLEREHEERRRMNCAATVIHRSYRGYQDYRERIRLTSWRLEVKSVNIIIRAYRSFRTRVALQERVMLTAERKAALQRFINYYAQHNWIVLHWIMMFNRRAKELQRMRMRNRGASMLQRMFRRVMRDYNLPVRVAARIQLQKKRLTEKKWLAAITIQRFYRQSRTWMSFVHRMRAMKQYLIRHRALMVIKKFVKAIIINIRILHAHQRRVLAQRRAAEEQLKYEAALCINRIWRHYRDRCVSQVRFFLRKKMLIELKKMEDAKLAADEERERALAEVRATEEAMAATIGAAWRQGSDATGRNYYYNYVTGESSWTMPKDFKLPPVDDCWVRNADDRGYFIMIIQESRWLPPCTRCGIESKRWCEDCQLAYCERDFDDIHSIDNPDQTMCKHIWHSVETTKDKLERGEVHCHECKVRKGNRMCTTCWDAYCDKCFKNIHKAGALKLHKSIKYTDAKKGWYCIKAMAEDEKDYYVNGATGETTYDKPESLMTESELEYYKNFIAHKEAAEDHVKRIEALQYDLEKMKYDRDLNFVNQSLENTETDKGRAMTNNVAANLANKKSMSLFGSNGGSAYRKKILKADDRRRGKARSEYIENVLKQFEEDDPEQADSRRRRKPR